MSPEQARGSKIDGRADVFSLGCVLYECVSGAKPFHEESLTAILLKVVAEPAPPIDFGALGLPRALDGVLRKAMAKDPGQRFASPGELMEAARQAARGVEVAPPPVSPTGTLVATPAVGPAGTTVPEPPHPRTPSSPVSRALSAAGAAWRQLSWPLAALAVVVIAGGMLGVVALLTPDANPSRPPAPGGRLVVEEELGPIARLFGQEPRLLITVPGETRLSLEIQTPISSATARRGDTITAGVRKRIVIEGHEAIGSGARIDGRVTRVESAEDAGGRGRLALEFSAVTLLDGARVGIQSDPVELMAPPPRPAKRRRGGLAGAWDKVTSAVEEFVTDVKGELAGGVSGAQAVQGGAGVDIEVPAGSTLDIRLTREVTVTRARTP
jgi:hypothetical protein